MFVLIIYFDYLKCIKLLVYLYSQLRIVLENMFYKFSIQLFVY
jgi:hypothetical protein